MTMGAAILFLWRHQVLDICKDTNITFRFLQENMNMTFLNQALFIHRFEKCFITRHKLFWGASQFNLTNSGGYSD